MLEEEHVPRLLQLVVGEEAGCHGAGWRHGQCDEASPGDAGVVDGGVGGEGTPVVSDQHSLVVAFELLVEADGVEAEYGALVVAVGGYVGGGVAAHPGGDG